MNVFITSHRRMAPRMNIINGIAEPVPCSLLRAPAVASRNTGVSDTREIHACPDSSV